MQLPVWQKRSSYVLAIVVSALPQIRIHLKVVPAGSVTGCHLRPDSRNSVCGAQELVLNALLHLDAGKERLAQLLTTDGREEAGQAGSAKTSDAMRNAVFAAGTPE